LKKGNNSLAASIPTLPGGALKGGGKTALGTTNLFCLYWDKALYIFTTTKDHNSLLPMEITLNQD
jgi:hypothetical protein